jgi:prepilin-type N-terminal cleavage/methylation domain-containing protein
MTRQFRKSERGLSMPELLVVIGIIGVIAAFGLPNVLAGIRSGRIRQAQSDLLSIVQKARNKAIATNTRQGVLFVIQDSTTYWIHVEDDASNRFVRTTLNLGAPNALYSTRYTLPTRVEFGANAADCSGIPGFAATQSVIRFDSFGARRIPLLSPSGSEPAASITGTVTSRIHAANSAGEAGLCIVDRQTGLRRSIQISSGGRILNK